MVSGFLSGVVGAALVFGGGLSAQEARTPNGLGLAPDLHLPKEMPAIHDACKRGDESACAEFRALMDANRQYHDLWRRYRPEYFD